VITAYLAAEGFEAQLAEELRRAGLGPSLRPAHGRLLISDAAPVDAAWAINTWFDAEELPVRSIGDAARLLRDRQRNWVAYAPTQRGRAGLVTARLPHVSGRSLALGEAAPTAPLGSWTLLAADRMLAAGRCSSPFPNGEPALAEIRPDIAGGGPPSRAYRKLWEALLRLGRAPGPGQRCVDLGASPGGWTWLISELGASVVAVDRAPLDPAVAARPGVQWLGTSAFGIDPQRLAAEGPLHWVFGDIACYPERLLLLVQQWRALRPAPAVVMTVKFQGPTDHDVTDRLRALPGARCWHLHHNKHELTLAILDAAATDPARTDPATPGRSC